MERERLGRALLSPADFTPVCTTELGAVAKLKSEFDKRNVKVIGLSVDPLDAHRRWAGDIKDVTGAALNFPLIADPDRSIAQQYDMIHPNASETATVRSVFVIGPDNKVKLTLTYPASTGRNFDGAAAGHRLAAAHRRHIRWRPRPTGSRARTSSSSRRCRTRTRRRSSRPDSWRRSRTCG